MLQFQHILSHLTSKLAMPHPEKTTMCRFCPFWCRFQPNGWGAADFNVRRDKLAYPPVHTQNWKCTLVFLKMLPTGWYIGTFLRTFRGTIRKIGLLLGGYLGIRRGNIAPQTFLAPLVNSEFNVDYDFAIKHDQIQSDDWVMDFCVIPRSRWAPKFIIIPEVMILILGA